MKKTGKLLSLVLCLIMTASLMLIGAPSVSATTLFSDNFDDGDAAGWTPQTNYDYWQVVQDSGNYCYYASSSTKESRSGAGTQGWTDYSVEAKMKVTNFNGTANRAMLCGRYLDGNNYYTASLLGGTSVEIRKKVSGSSTTLVSKTYTISTNTWYTVKLEMVGSSIKMYVNGNLELSTTDNSRSSGGIGVIAVKAQTEYDDIVVSDSVGGTPTPVPTATPTPGPPTATPTPGTPTPTPGPTPTLDPNAYYVATNGNDSNSGAIDQPFLTIGKGVSMLSSGRSTVYVRGGTYNISTVPGVSISSAGTASINYKLFAYPGETPVINFSGQARNTNARGFNLTSTAAYWHIKGLELCYAGDNALYINGHHNTIENCVFHDNDDTGLQISNATATDNFIKNCDSYRNYDPAGNGGNADGFACKLSAGAGNKFVGCRAWENSDDGWDFYDMAYQIVMENCWTWRSGDNTVFGVNINQWGGNGNGFKVGGNYAEGPHILKNCVAFNNVYGKTGANTKGFDQNHNMSGVTMYNCLSFNNEYNYSLAEAPTDNQNPNHILKNCVGFGATISNTSLAAGTVQQNDSWTLSVTADSADFADLTETLAKAARQADGSLPNNNFAKLVAGSDLINQGVDVGIAYLGSAPDLGAYERE